MVAKLLADRYELGEELGAGGMGRVLRAHDTRLDRQVAIKFLRENTDEVNHARMEAEARMAGSLQHPGIAQVFDYVPHEGADSPESTDSDSPHPHSAEKNSFIVMQLIEGESLATILRGEGALSAEAVARLVTEIAEALHAAHTAGVVHRDLKPANIIITPAGRPVLVDFGIARSRGSEPLTDSGVLVGTADYISPEQASGRTATAASDLYSLGVVAHHCLTGQSPFRRESSIATALAHVRESPPPIDTAPELADLVIHMLAKSPQDRPASAHEVATRAAPLAGLSAPNTLVPSPLAEPGHPATEPASADLTAPATGPMTGPMSGPMTGPMSAPDTESNPTSSPASSPTSGTASDAGDERGHTAAMVMPLSPPPSPPPHSAPVSAPDHSPLASRGPLRRVLVGLIAAIAVLSALLFGGAVFSGDPEVPDVVGLDLASAEQLLAREGFTVRVERVDSPTVEADLVVTQDPPASTVTPRDVVTLEVATGQVTIRAEDILGLPYEDAASALEELGLSVAREEATSSESAGTVVAIDLTGRVDIGATVSLTVARAPIPAPVAPQSNADSDRSPRADDSDRSDRRNDRGNRGRGQDRDRDDDDDDDD